MKHDFFSISFLCRLRTAKSVRSWWCVLCVYEYQAHFAFCLYRGSIFRLTYVVAAKFSTILQMRKAESQTLSVNCLKLRDDKKVTGAHQTWLVHHFLFPLGLLHVHEGILNKRGLSPFLFHSLSLFLLFILVNRKSRQGSAVGRYVGNKFSPERGSASGYFNHAFKTIQAQASFLIT